MRPILNALGINAAFTRTLEAALVGLFFVQALRFAIGTYYSRLASASIAALIPPEAVPQVGQAPGFVLPGVVQGEITLLLYMAALPLLLILVGRFRILLLLAALLTAAGRTLMVAPTAITPAAASALAIGGGLLYIVLMASHRPSQLPYALVLAFAADQLIRAAGNTFDPTWSASYFPVQLGLFIGVMLLATGNTFTEQRGQRRARQSGEKPRQERGLLTFWGGISFGAILFLQITLLALPNAIGGRANLSESYPTLVPVLFVATVLPLFSRARRTARDIISVFDSSVRGWVWLLLTGLLLVLGTRFSGVVSLVGFVGAQFTVSMLWWWIVRPQAERERNLGGLWMFFGTLVFTILLLFDVFTYEYAYVRPFAAPLDVLNGVLLPLLRGFRGLGYAVILIAALLGALAMVQSPRRIAWRPGGTVLQNFLLLVVTAGATGGAAYLAAPPVIPGVFNVDGIRVGTYNIHSGYSEFHAYTLEEMAQTIEQSGVNVVLLQEVDAGRTTSFGVDQPLWLARRLGMDTRFFPTNEGLQGLAVLSNVSIAFDDGELLPGLGQQTGLQRVQILTAPDTVVTIYNTWLGLLLDDGTLDQQEQDQQRQLNEILRIINEHHPSRQLGRTVVGGTFNNIPDSPLIQRMDEVGFSDPFAGSPIERSATLVRTGLSARVDYLWIYPEMADGVGVLQESAASDHRLAFVGLDLGTP